MTTQFRYKELTNNDVKMDHFEPGNDMLCYIFNDI